MTVKFESMPSSRDKSSRPTSSNKTDTSEDPSTRTRLADLRRASSSLQSAMEKWKELNANQSKKDIRNQKNSSGNLSKKAKGSSEVRMPEGAPSGDKPPAKSLLNKLKKQLAVLSN